MRKLYYLLLLSGFIYVNPLFSQEKTIIGLLTERVSFGSDKFSHIQAGDTLWVESGIRPFLIISDFVGTPDKPIVFINYGGQVIFDSERSFGIDLRGCSNIKITGTGDQEYKYGFYIRKLTHESSVGLGIGYKTSDFELENIEISNTGFAGILAKTDPNCNDLTATRGLFVQKNSIIHDLYIHDVNGEGIYLGSTSYNGFYINGCNTFVYPPNLEGVRVYNNIIENSGFDGIQVSSASSDCKIFNNTVINDSRREINFQMSGIIVGGGSKCDCYNNVIKNGKGTGILYFGFGGGRIFNNLIVNPGRTYVPEDYSKHEHGIYVSDRSYGIVNELSFFNNTIISPKSNGISLADDVKHNCIIRNNVIIDPGSFGIEQSTIERASIHPMSSEINISMSHNYMDINIVLAGFVNPQTDDFHLSETSALVDAGTDLTSIGINFDLENRTRPKGRNFDQGVYESDWVNQGSEFTDIELFQNFPNPGKTSTTFKYIINKEMDVRLCLIDSTGKLVKILVEESKNEGEYEYTLDLDEFHNQVYYYVLEANTQKKVRKLIVFN